MDNGLSDSSDDDEEYEESGGNQLLGFMFGNVDNAGDLDADYLDEDAKEHLSALADKLGPSLTDIDLSERSPRMLAETGEQDYDEKAEDAVDYEDIDEQYEGPEIQAASEEDYLLAKKNYFSSAVSLAAMEPTASLFDDENYDEDEECEKDNDVLERKSETKSSISEKEDSPEHDGQLGLFGTKYQLEGAEDIQQGVADVVGDTLDGKGSTPLPILCIEDGMVILRFSEIFGIHEPLKKEEKRDHRYFTYKEKYKFLDASDLVEEDEEAFLKGYSQGVSFMKLTEVSQHDIVNDDGSEFVNSGFVQGASQMSVQLSGEKKDSCCDAEPLEQHLTVNLSFRRQVQLCANIFPLDQQEWEHRILWDNSPTGSDNLAESCELSEPDSEPLLVRETELQARSRNFQTDFSFKQHEMDHGIVIHNSPVSMETFSLGESYGPKKFPLCENRFHPQLLRLESWVELDDRNQEYTGKESSTPEFLQSDTLRCLGNLSLQNRDMIEESWLDNIIWEPQKTIPKPKLIFDLQDEQMLFEISDNKDSEQLQLHAGAMIISHTVKPTDKNSFELQGRKSQSGWQFNISNDKFYMNGKTCQQLQTNSNKRMVHSFKIHHSAPALKLQTMKLKLSNKDIANFHRPRALWYPHDNELAVKEQGKLPTHGPMKIIIKSLGGKGSKLHVDADETVSSMKAKTSKKLDFKPTETVKMFYLGKELKDDKSLAMQNVQPNSLVHLVRTKIHLWPKAQKLPGENKSLRPPGAFKKKSDLSVKDGHVILMEYCEERPLLLSNVGMGANMCTYYRKSAPGDQSGNFLCNGNSLLGNVLILEPGDKSPFLGDIRAGCSQSSLETNMSRAPIFAHKVPPTDYLLVRSAKGKLSIRRIDRVAVVGQQEPLMEVMSPGSKYLQTYMVNRMLVHAYREFAKGGLHPSIGADELSLQFPSLSEAVIRKKMKDCASLRKDRWYRKSDFAIPSENELRKMVTPEHVCAYESMQAGLYRLKHLGITRLTLPASISSAMTQLPDEAIALAAASHIERELQITPWNLSSNFVACINQDRGNIERLEITGVGDPSGRGLGFSYVRAAPKAPMSGALLKKKAAAGRGGSSVTGTDADLRRLSMEAAREVLLKFNVPEELIARQTRWHRIAMIRKLSSEQATSGVKVDPTTTSKYARGQRMSFLQLQQQTREKCQEIWDRQVQSLSAVDQDENDSDSEANSDLDSFAGDLENLLDAEECEEGEEGNNSSKHDRLDCVKGLKMRRRPSQVQVEEEVEDEAAEAAEFCRLLMDDDEDEQKKKKKKKAKAVAEEAGPSRGTQSKIGLEIVARVKKTNAIAKKILSTTQPDGTFTKDENIVRDPMDVESSSLKQNMSGKEKASNKSGISVMGQLKKVKILGDKVKMFKVKKSARETFVCGACGQLGHMRTNKNCPKYGEDTEAQVETTNLEKSSGKSNSLDPSGPSQLKAMKKKIVSKSATKISVVEAPEGENLSSKTKVLPVKFRCGPADKQLDKPAPAVTQSCDQTVISDIEAGSKSVTKISKIIISNKAKPDVQVESDKQQPLVDIDRGHVESHKPPVFVRSHINTKKDEVESHRPSIVIRPPTEKDKEQPQKKIIFKRPKEVTDHDQISQDGSPQFEHRKTKRIVELSGLQKHGKQESLRLNEESSKRKAREERRWWEEEARRTSERHRGERARRVNEGEMRGLEERERFAEIKRYEEAIRKEREEEERQKAKKKKKKQPGIRDDYLDDYQARRAERRIPERERSAKRRSVVDLGRYGAESTVPTKRRRGGEVGLANILEHIVETLRDNSEVSFLFLKPVSKKEAPDYLDIIQRPMDLSTIRDKVRRMEYKDREHFRHDVWQIAYNAHMYNDGRNPGIPPLADQLLELCDYLLDEHHESLSEAEAGIESRD